MSDRHAHLSSNQRVGNALRLSADLVGRDVRQIDRPQLVAQDDGVLGLASVAAGERYAAPSTAKPTERAARPSSASWVAKVSGASCA